MNPTIVRRSKSLSWLLRHGAAEAGVVMDAAGWVDVPAVLRALAMSREDFLEAVETNEKRRFDLDAVSDRVRAAQGHSGAVPIDLEALESSWTVWTATDPIFHGTYRGALSGIVAQGLLPRTRTHVHMITERASIAGKRAGVDLLLVIDPSQVRRDGLRLFASPNGVVLARHVPRAAIFDLEPVTRRGRLAEREMREALGLED